MQTSIRNSYDKVPIELDMKASIFSRRTDIKFGSEVVGNLFRDAWTAKDMLKERRTYHISVAPGMDMALMLAMVLYTHERVVEYTYYSSMLSAITAASTGGV